MIFLYKPWFWPQSRKIKSPYWRTYNESLAPGETYRNLKNSFLKNIFFPFFT
jgi:hypothetical protein